MEWLRKKLERHKEKERQKYIDLRLIQSEKVKLWFDNENKAHLSYDGKELTKYFGLSVDILTCGKWHSSSSFDYQISKLSDQELKVAIRYNHLPIALIWELSVFGNKINWSISLKVESRFSMDCLNAKAFFSKYYTRWVIPLAEDNFLPYFDAHWHCIDFFGKNYDFVGIVSNQPDLPSVIFSIVQERKSRLNIQNTDLNLSSRVFEGQVEGEELYEPGVYKLITNIMELFPKKSILEDKLNKFREEDLYRQQEEERKRKEEELCRQQEEERKRKEEDLRRQEEEKLSKQLELIKLQDEAGRLERERQEEILLRSRKKDPLSIFFDQDNQLHINSKNIEVTKVFGLEVAILSDGIWHFSRNQKAEVEKASCDDLTIYFTDEDMPLTGIWNFRLLPENRLDFNLNLHIRESLRIDSIVVFIYLSKNYSQWLSSTHYGEFPHQFLPDRQVLFSCKSENAFVSARSASLDYPGVLFKILHGPKAVLDICNSEETLSARIFSVKFEIEKEVYPPETFDFFKGTLQFYLEPAVLENKANKIKEEELCRQQEEERKRKEEELCRQQEEERKRKEEEKSVFVAIDKNLSSINEVRIYNGEHYSKDEVGKKNIKIGVSRFNFFRIKEILQFYSLLIGEHLDLRSVVLSYFPVKKLYINFIDYIKELNARLVSSRLSLFLEDELLLDILFKVSAQADRYNERDLLRLLGVIAEHPFIGPQTIVMDTFHLCNTNCVHCWVHNPKRNYPKDLENLKMDDSLFKRVIDDAASLLSDEIIIQGDGEPLLDTRLLTMIRYARERGLKVLFFTNAICLDKDTSRQIIDLGVNEIFCSLPAGTGETYAQINPKQSKETFLRIIDNLKNFVAIRNALGKNKPMLQMTHVIHNLNCQELEKMAKVDAAIGADKVRFYLARLDENIGHLKLGIQDIEKIRITLPIVEDYFRNKNIALQDNIYFQLENYDYQTGFWSKNKFIKSGCLVGWFFCLILAKGEVSMCCHLRLTGHLKNKSFKEIWDSKEYNDTRIKAKRLGDSSDANNQIYDESCNQCDTHQVILMIEELLKRYKLDKYLEGIKK